MEILFNLDEEPNFPPETSTSIPPNNSPKRKIDEEDQIPDKKQKTLNNTLLYFVLEINRETGEKKIIIGTKNPQEAGLEDDYAEITSFRDEFYNYQFELENEDLEGSTYQSKNLTFHTTTFQSNIAIEKNSLEEYLVAATFIDEKFQIHDITCLSYCPSETNQQRADKKVQWENEVIAKISKKLLDFICDQVEIVG